jgi:hypothetical protein
VSAGIFVAAAFANVSGMRGGSRVCAQRIVCVTAVKTVSSGASRLTGYGRMETRMQPCRRVSSRRA